MRRVAALALTASTAVTSLGTAPASGEEIIGGGTPDGRARVSVTGSFDPGSRSGSLGVSGNAGAIGFDHALRGRASQDGYFEVTNPPMGGAGRCDGAGCRLTYEELYGPPVTRAVMGAGLLTAGVEEHGRLSNLSWPGPGYWEHVNYLNVSRGLPNKGAPANAGSFGGWGSGWLHPDFGWRRVSQGWTAERAQTFETVLRNDALGATATVTDVVAHDDDVLARNFSFECDAGECPDRGFAYYANMNPTTGRVPRVPSVGDAALDDVSDFATVYDPGAGAMLHFRPYKADPAAATRLLTGQYATGSPDGFAQDAAAALADTFGPGVYLAVGGAGAPGSFQAGLDSFGLVRDEAAGTPLLDPYYDLTSDGALSGSHAAAGKTAGGLAGMPADADGSYTVYLAAAEDPRDAVGSIERARRRGFGRIRAASERWWERWTHGLALPGTDARTDAVSLRALMAIRTAMDARSGAILANAATQTPYRQDWPRDGAFFTYALLAAGKPGLAIEHERFYARVYRPGGTWDSFYYADGAEAGLAWPYEIDTQGFALWGLWLPYEFRATAFRNERQAERYLADVYPAIRDTAEALLLCRDPSTGLMCPAPEDDATNPPVSQGAQGAATTYLALRRAADAADALGRDADRAAAWRARAAELRAAVLAHVCDETKCQGGRGGIYLVWPSELLGADDPFTQSHLAQFAAQMDRWSSRAEPAIGGFFQYPMEPLLALNHAWQDPDRAARLQGWVEFLTNDVAEPASLHYGERIFRCAGEPPCAAGEEYLHSIGFPHIWSGTETYLAALGAMP